MEGLREHDKVEESARRRPILECGLLDEKPLAGGDSQHAREASIRHRLAKGAADIPTIVRAVYIGLDPRLSGAAGYSVLAHLEDMTARGEVLTDGPPSITGVYRLAGS